MQIIFLKSILFIFCLFFLTQSRAAITMKEPFGSHMVLQRGMKVNIWGKANAGENISISFNNQVKNVVTSANGNWKLQLDPMVAGGPFVMTVRGTNTITFEDVYVGEVWQCAGQSNIGLTMNEWKTSFPNDINTANFPKFRFMNMRGATKAWNVMTPTTVLGCSATGFFFGRDLLQNLDCAVGLLVTAVGGTFIEQWFEPATVAAFAGKINAGIAAPGNMYNQYVAPVVSFGIRGTVWIQGEQNAEYGYGAEDYGDRFKAIITGWRKVWGQGNFPFYFGQITAAKGYQAEPFPISSSALVREGQRTALELPQTAMSTMMDISGGGWHYWKKNEAGRRLALAPKVLIYGKSGEYEGPLFESFSVTGSNATIKFTHSAGLKIDKGTALTGFALAGLDGVWQWAEKAAIVGNTVVISTSKVPKPVKVSLGWNDRPQINLFNSDGLQASPFIGNKASVITTFEADEVWNETNNDVMVYPNPLIGNTLNFNLLDLKSEFQLSISGLSGELLFNKKINSQDLTSDKTVDLSFLSKGVYLLQIKTDISSRTTKLLRE